MYYRLIKKDILKNKAITLAITLFITAAAMLVALAAILIVNLTAIDTLMEKAETTHFMQMHSGVLDTKELNDFAVGHGNVEKFQVLEFLNIDGSKMIFPSTTLGSSMQDNGLSKQSDHFDYLLDLDGNVIRPKDGELYVPICYMRDNTAKVGDLAVIGGKNFTVAGFLRDSQMNSELSSSKRFLVSENDFADMQNLGDLEYLIEFRLIDRTALGAFETAYIAAGLPANGPTVSYSLFKIMNGFSDGIMIGMILLVSLLVVAVAFLCIRFTLIGKIEDETREIGVMKAIGLRSSDIRKVYLAKYAAIGICGCLLGVLLSLIFDGFLTENIRLYMGKSEYTSLAPLLGTFGVLLIFFAVIAYVNRVLNRLRKISAAEAIRFGAGQEKASQAKRFYLHRNKVLTVNIFLGIKDVLARKSLYGTMLVVIVIAVFIMIVPQNLYSTISARNFGGYMGIGDYDLRVDIQQSEDSTQKAEKIELAMSTDPAIAKVVILTTKIFKTSTGENLKVELGDHSVFPVSYTKGNAPTTDSDIALSQMNADELAKQVGDIITLYIDDDRKQLTICGIYSDITNGGKTAKAVFKDNKADSMWSIICADATAPSLITAVADNYTRQFPFAKISSTKDYITQIFGQTIGSVKRASYSCIVIAVFITILVTLLFMKMLITKDKASIAAMKAIGFTNIDITKQYAVRAIFVLSIGTLLGTLLANTLGEALGSMAISAFGTSSFQFTINPLFAYLLCPAAMVCSVLIGTMLGTKGVGRIKISENIKEA